MTFRITIGIDPGQTGALAIVADGAWAGFHDMPTMPRPGGNGLHVNGAALAEALREVMAAHPGADVLAVLEEVGAMPKQGVTSTFRFGEGYGVIRGVLGALRVPFVTVRPDRWKRDLRLAGLAKDSARTAAIQRFPSAACQLARKKDCGRADALLIAHWAHATEQIGEAA